MIKHTIVYEDKRYPTLVLDGEFGVVAYTINMETGELRKVCACGARYDDDCICGSGDNYLKNNKCIRIIKDDVVKNDIREIFRINNSIHDNLNK